MAGKARGHAKDKTPLFVLSSSLIILTAVILLGKVSSPAGGLVRIESADGSGSVTIPEYDVAVINLALTTPPEVGPINYSYTVINLGSRQIVSSWGINLTNPVGGFGWEACCIYLGPGEVSTIAGTFWATREGLYRLTAFSNIQGHTDSRLYNNRMTIEFNVTLPS